MMEAAFHVSPSAEMAAFGRPLSLGSPCAGF